MDKICSKCGLKKPRAEFYKNCRQRDGLSYQCKFCDKASVRKYASSERGKATRDRNRATEHYKDIERCSQEKRKDVKNIRNARYCKTPRGRLLTAQKARRRRELKRDLDLQLTATDISRLYQIFDSQCFHCGNEDYLQIDHHRPLSKGFGLSIQNAVLLCRSCNAAKHNKMPEDFYTSVQLEALRGYGIF